MVVIDIDGERLASFRNARESVEIAQRATQISYSNLKTLCEQLDGQSVALEGLKFATSVAPKIAANAEAMAA